MTFVFQGISYFTRLHNIPEKCKQCNKMYHKGIPFAEHNFSPFQDIFFVIVLFESQSKTLFRVLFSSLYLQICIFYFGISKYLNLRESFDGSSTGNTL